MLIQDIFVGYIMSVSHSTKHWELKVTKTKISVLKSLVVLRDGGKTST